jgi:uncharacterized protein involved in exopolysaccharide biosynthesis
MEQIPIWDALRPRIWMIVALCIVAVAAGYVGSFVIAERYEASALVLVRPEQAIKIDTNKGDKEFLDFPVSHAATVETPSKTYIEIIKSPELIGTVVGKLSLEKDEVDEEPTTFLKKIKDGAKQIVKDVLAFVRYGRLIEDDAFTKAVKRVQYYLTLKSSADTYVFEIKYAATEAHRAAEVANTAANSFIDLIGQMRSSEAKSLRDHLKKELDQSRQQVETARERVESYKKSHSTFLYDPEYTAKLREISDLELELAKMEQGVAGSQGTLSTVSYAARRARLLRMINERKAEMAPLPGIERELKQFELDLKTTASAYEILDKEFKEADVRYSYASPGVSMVSQAIPPQLPSTPKREIIVLAALLGGLVIGVALAFLLEYRNRGVRGVEDVEDFIGVKVLATIPRVSGRRWQNAGLL